MKAKRYIATAIAAGICTFGLLAAENNGLKVYINPGHGGHESNDRNVVIYPYAQGDPNGYWESNSNLDKGLALRDMLIAKGYQVEMSRTTNTELTLTDADKAGVHIYGDLTDNEVYLEFTGETGVMYAKVCNMDFLGWRYIPVDLTALEGGLPYSLSGIRLVQKSSMMSKSGAFKIDDIYKLDGEGSGVADVDIATVSVYPNPASEYIIANGGIVIESLTLVSLEGVTVASRGGERAQRL